MSFFGTQNGFIGLGMIGRASHGPAVDHTSSLAYCSSQGSSSDLTTYTFSSMDLGAAHAERYIVVAVSHRASTVRSISSASIGGVSASVVYHQASGQSANSVIIAKVPSGTTGDVVVTFNSTAVRCGVAVYSITNLGDTTPIASDQADSATANLSFSPASAAHCIGWTQNGNTTSTMSCAHGDVAAGSRSATATQTASATAWSGALTEDADFALEGTSTAVRFASVVAFERVV